MRWLRRDQRRADEALLSAEQWLDDDGAMTLDEIAESHGLEPEVLVETLRALGLPADPNEAVYGAGTQRHAERIARYLDQGFSYENLLLFNRVVGRAFAALAATAADLLIDRVVEDEEDAARRAFLGAQLIVEGVPLIEEGMSFVFREHIRQMLRAEVAGQLESGEPGATEPIAVGFVDMVGFTRRGQMTSARELGELAQRLETTAHEICGDEVTVVKVIGDAVMLVARKPDSLVVAVCKLLAMGEDPSADLPPMRAGAAFGVAARRGGDYFGHTVNVASRLTAVAEPHTLAADKSLSEEASEAATWSSAGRRELRGVERPVEVYTAHG